MTAPLITPTVMPTHNLKLLTTAEVGRQLGVDPATVRRWIDDKRLRACRPGRGYRVHPDDLQAFLRASMVTSTPLTA